MDSVSFAQDQLASDVRADEAPDPFARTGLTYDDVLLLPGETDVIPSEADTSTRLTRRITLRIPLLSAAMDTVTESRMAVAMAREGGIGILHRNLSIENQAHMVDQVKRSEAGMVSEPITVSPDATLADVVNIDDGFLKTDAGKGFALVGPDYTDEKYFGNGAGIAVRKGDKALADKISAAILAIRANGKYKEVQDKYFQFNVYGE